MKTTMLDKEKTRYIRRFKTLLNEGSIDRNAELAMLGAYGVESCKDMNVYELMELCQKVELLIKPDLAKMDRVRKNALASISGYLELTGKKGMSWEYVKAIACRSAKIDTFNKISESALHEIIGEFNRKQRVRKSAQEIKAEAQAEAKVIASLN